jgi:hypothetical protein
VIQKKSKLMIVFAVIAVIIVAVPVSFYEFSDQTGAKILKVNNEVSNYEWHISSNNFSGNPIVFQNITTNSTFASNNSMNSSLSLSFSRIIGYCSGTGFFSICIDYFNISGILRRDLRPSGITVKQTDAAQVPHVIKFGLVPFCEKAINISKIQYGNFWGCNDKTSNKTGTYTGASTCNLTLLNDSAMQNTIFSSHGTDKNSSYSFELSNSIHLRLWQSYNGDNVTNYAFSLMISLNGLGKKIQTQINIEMIRKSAT